MENVKMSRLSNPENMRKFEECLNDTDAYLHAVDLMTDEIAGWEPSREMDRFLTLLYKAIDAFDMAMNIWGK